VSIGRALRPCLLPWYGASFSRTPISLIGPPESRQAVWLSGQLSSPARLWRLTGTRQVYYSPAANSWPQGIEYKPKGSITPGLLTLQTRILYCSYHNNKKEVDMVQAYCMKCRTKKEMKDPKAITMKNGKPATQGTCPTCGTKMFRIGKT